MGQQLTKRCQTLCARNTYTYTWYDEGNTYMPGRLDYMLYTGSVMRLENSFVFETANLDLEILQDQNLLTTDSRRLQIICP